MQLFWSPRSPFVRKAMIVAHEAGVADRIERIPVRVTPTDPDEAVLARNPLGKIPTLVLPDGTALFDSSVICAFFDGLHDGEPLIPRDPADRLTALRWEALGDGLAEILLAWMTERFRRQEGQSERRVAVCRSKLERTLALLDREAGELMATPVGVGHAAIASALGYLEFRFAEEEWRAGHPRLASWHAGFEARPSAVATAFYDELTRV